VLLPISYPYNDPVQVMICGGATGERVGLDTCISIAPEVPGAQWIVEVMPSRRVLTCIAPLADATFLIVNGAKFGVAGFASASDPNLAPVIYDPFKPIGARMAQMNPSPWARLYHSEATLLLDGTVLISGSDPRDPNFPQEYRVERFTPPYLLDGKVRPRFTIENKDWTYGQLNRVNLKGPPGFQVTNMRAVLVGAASSTHGNTMGTRTIVPSLKCMGYLCHIQAPPTTGICPPGWFMLFVLDGPTPSLGQWVRIGGDPGQLGNWPPGPGFTRPGI